MSSMAQVVAGLDSCSGKAALDGPAAMHSHLARGVSYTGKCRPAGRHIRFAGSRQRDARTEQVRTSAAASALIGLHATPLRLCHVPHSSQAKVD